MKRPLTAYSFARTRRPLRRQLQPDAVRLFYFSALRALMAKAHAMVTAELLPLVHELRPDDRQDATHGDGWLRLVDPLHIDASDEERIRSTVQRLAKQFSRSLTPNKLKPLAEQVAKRTADFQKAQLQGQLQQVLSVAPFIRDEGLAIASAKFTTENVSLIKTVPERYFAQLEQVVVDGVAAGSRAGTIANEIEERYGVAESNALRIANDQVGKFYGELNQTRQEELGITGYVWNSAHDNRVRDEHRQLDGSAQAWDSPPEGGGTDAAEPGHPGSGINCRCFASPDVSDLL